MQITVAELAKLINAEIVGNNNAVLHTVAKIEEGHTGALSFLANPKYESYLYTTNSTAVLVNKTFVPTQQVNTTLLKVDDAYATFTFLLEKFSNPAAQLSGVMEGSYVSTNATLDAKVYVGFGSYIGEQVTVLQNTKIYPQVFVGNNVKIGSNCIIYPGVKIYHDCVIGNNVIIHAGTIIGCDGFGFAPLADKSYKKIPQTGNVIIEDDVELGSNCTIDRATMGSTIIKKGVKLDNMVHLAHNVEIGEHTVIAAQTGVAGSTKLGKYIMTGGQVGFAGHITVANGNMFGAQSGIANTISEENKKWFGSPAYDLKDSMRSISVYRKLPDLLKRIELLEKELDKLKNN